jgi:hypothetical protein
MSVRGIFGSISAGWSSLTNNQRASWDGFVAAYSSTDVFGDIRNPSGKNLYQQLNQNLLNSGQAVIQTCVAPVTVPFANLTSVLGDVSSSTMVAETDGNTTGCKMVFFATPSLSQGTKFVKNRLRQIGVITGGDNLSNAIYALYTAKFGAPVVGANVYIGVKVINANGQASPLETVKATIQA